MAGLAAIVTGIGLVGVGAAVGIHKAHRKPVPVDARAQFIAALQSGNVATMTQIANAYNVPGNKSQHQAQLVLRAMKATVGDTKIPADVAALYNGTLQSGDPATMRTVAKQLSAKYPHLAGALTDTATILGG